ncbi:hypothetical protein [Albidovulum sp.]
MSKAGSSTIQGWLRANHVALADQGIRYDPFARARPEDLPATIGFACLGVHLAGRTVPDERVRSRFGLDSRAAQASRVAEFERRADAAIARADYHTYVISSEYLHNWLGRPEWSKAFHVWLAERFDAVDYVFYLRDQVDWIVSAHAQGVKMGSTRSLEETLSLNGEVNYFAICNRWVLGTAGASFGIRLLERDALTGGDLVADFAALLGATRDSSVEAPRLNMAMSAEALRIMLRINRYAARHPDRLPPAARAAMAQKLLKRPGSRLALTKEQSLQVARANRENNEKLRRRYFPDRPYLFERSYRILAEAGEVPVAAVPAEKAQP